jgi:acylphosphatase
VAPRRRVHVFVTGRVQGVWFRASARECALALGLAGDARNLSDGRVEIHAEGTPAAIESFLAWCAEGPSGARVDSVEVEDQEPVGGAAEFRITRE